MLKSLKLKPLEKRGSVDARSRLYPQVPGEGGGCITASGDDSMIKCFPMPIEVYVCLSGRLAMLQTRWRAYGWVGGSSRRSQTKAIGALRCPLEMELVDARGRREG